MTEVHCHTPNCDATEAHTEGLDTGKVVRIITGEVYDGSTGKTHEVQIADTEPDKPILTSDVTEEQFTKLNVYRRMLEIGLESIIFSCDTPDKFFKDHISINDLKREHERVQKDFGDLMKESYRLSDAERKVTTVRVNELLNNIKGKVFSFLRSLSF